MLVGLGAALAIGVETITGGHPAASEVSAPSTAVPGSPSSAGALTAAAVARKVDPAVVDINTVVETAQGNGAAAGTGIILTSGGEVLTNNHVVQGAVSVRVTVTALARTYSARVVGADPAADVAVLQIQGAAGLPTASLADSSKLKVGEAVYAFGNALGQGGTPSQSSGRITALDQSITARDNAFGSEQLSGMIQVDAQVAPGDSGGPLADSKGQVIGMITADQVAGFGGASSAGYAIPTNSALAVVEQIRSGRSGGSIVIGQTGYLGVDVRDLDPETAATLGDGVTSGALVLGVQPGSAAASAGLAPGAVITSVGSSAVGSVSDLEGALHGYRPGQQVRIAWTDQTGMHTATVTLGAGPAV